MVTERLIIDALKESDKEDYFINISHDKKVLQTFICNYAETIDELDFDKYFAYKDLYAIRLRESNKLIGIILICEDKGNECEIGYGIGSKYWGNGYVTEATKCFINYLFNERNYNKIYASFFKENIASKRVMEKSGMKYSHVVEKELIYLDIERDLVYYLIEK